MLIEWARWKEGAEKEFEAVYEREAKAYEREEGWKKKCKEMEAGHPETERTEAEVQEGGSDTHEPAQPQGTKRHTWRPWWVAWQAGSAARSSRSSETRVERPRFAR